MNTPRTWTTHPPRTWRAGVHAVLWLLSRVLGWRVHARRPATLPSPRQPLIVVFNHTSNVDAFLVADTVWRRLGHWCQPLVKAELLRRPVLGQLLTHVGAVPVARSAGASREAAYAAAIARLRAGRTILVAPEATITHDGSLLPMRHGAARMALQAGVDVLAVTHFGAQRGFSPVIRMPERDVVVTMTMDLITPRADEDATALTGRIAAVMMDRSAQLQTTYPQRDPQARWWPPYATPARPTATARENLARYRQSMAEAVAQAQRRMTELAEDYEVEERFAHARDRVARIADEYDVEERLAQARQRMNEFAEEYEVEEWVMQARDRAQTAAEDLIARSRARTGAFAEQARHRLDEFTAPSRDATSAEEQRSTAASPGEGAGEGDADEGSRDADAE